MDAEMQLGRLILGGGGMGWKESREKQPILAVRHGSHWLKD